MLIMTVILSGTLAAVACWYLGLSGMRIYRYCRHVFQERMRDQMQQFFLFLDPGTLWGATLLLSAACTLLVHLLLQFWLLSSGTLAACLLLPRFLLSRWRRRRLERFDAQLPDFLLALGGALRAGAGVQAALRQLVADMPAPLGQEFALLLREQRMGVGFETALDSLNRRTGTEGAALMVSALQVAGSSGGNLAGTLEGIAQTLRDRQHMAGRIRALTAQGRLQAWIMACLPVGLILVLSWLQPQAMQPLWDTTQGWVVVGLILALETAGIVMVRRIVDIDI
ncbi:type II secretion system F family protein [Paracandidimonas soli]|uniref:Tight adherence protein B n=1 Tax=Paracandidimonas soli TaxID=1917182 RepID=A0A4R3VG93_9BURK|nr:type II secretion system F family protein [Paracandidimonas soli]TCV01865.1 tight adherence protein B [Paracandidimonas soli]